MRQAREARPRRRTDASRARDRRDDDRSEGPGAQQDVGGADDVERGPDADDQKPFEADSGGCQRCSSNARCSGSIRRTSFAKTDGRNRSGGTARNASGCLFGSC